MSLFRNQRMHVIASATILSIAALVVLYQWIDFSSDPTLRAPEAILEDALSTGESEADQARRRNAARELVEQADVATQSLRHIAEASNDSAVRATALQGLGKARDIESVPLLLKALEDPDARVRGQANAALIKIYQTDFGFRAFDEPDKRAAAAREWRQAVGRR